jgi:hypothetical protein
MRGKLTMTRGDYDYDYDYDKMVNSCCGYVIYV